MTKIKTFAVVRKRDGTMEAKEASVSVTFSEGKGIVIHGLSQFLIRESMLRTIKALNATGFVMPNKRIQIVYSLGTISPEESLIDELLDLPLAVAIMSVRAYAKFDLSVRYIGRLCPDGRVDEIDGFVVRACRLKWPPTFVSSLTYPNGAIRPDPGHTYLSTMMKDYSVCNNVVVLTKVEAKGTVVDVKVSEVGSVSIIYFKVQTSKGEGVNEQAGESQTRQAVCPNEAGGILECVLSNGQGGMLDIERMRQGVSVELVGRLDKDNRVIVHKIQIV